MSNIQIRRAHLSDAAGVAAVYADYMENTTASLDMEPPSLTQMECRICDCGAYYPFLVCELDGKIVGYAYAFRRFEEPSFDWSAFISVYASVGGKGISRALLDALEETLRAMGIVSIYAIVTHNDKSRYFHQARDFTEAGRLQEAIYKEGKWRDIAYYQKTIALNEIPPAPVRSVRDLDKAELDKILDRAGRSIRI